MPKNRPDLREQRVADGWGAPTKTRPRGDEPVHGLAVSPQADGMTILAGDLADQAALHGMLGISRDLERSVISVETAPTKSPSSTTG